MKPSASKAIVVPPKIATLIDGLCGNLQYRAELFTESWKLLCHAMAEHYGFCQVWLSRTAPEGTPLPIVGSSWIKGQQDGGPCAAYYRCSEGAGHTAKGTGARESKSLLIDRISCHQCPASGSSGVVAHIRSELEMDQDSHLSLSFHRPGDHAVIEDSILDEVRGIVRYVRRKLQNAAQYQDQMLLRASRASQVAMFLTDKEFRVTWINPALGEMCDFREEAVFGQRFDVLHTHVAPLGDEVAESMFNQLSAGLGWKGCLHDRSQDGHHRVIIETITPLLDQEGHPEAFMGVLQELSTQENEARDPSCFTDNLTGLLTRSYFLERMKIVLAHSTREHRKCALLFLDLDRFKQVNDQLGHVIGDHLLTVVGERMRQSTRGIDLVARYGGDEFIMLISEVDNDSVVEILANRVVESFSRPFAVDNLDLALGISVGIAIFPDHASDEESLVRCADTAMYEAKKAGGGYRIYRPPEIIYPCPV